MRKFKKWIAVAMAATMMMAVAGCGGKNDGPAEPTGASTPSPTSAVTPGNTENPGTTPEPTSTPEPKYDFGGRTITIGSYYDMTPDPEGDAYDQAFAERIAYVEETYNCNVEFLAISGEYYSQYVTSVLSGDPICDIGYIHNFRLLPAFIEGGIAYPVSDLGVFDFSDYKWRQDYIEAGTYKGKNYSFLTKDPEIRYGIFWNKTLFEQYGLPDLYELYDKGEWTWEKFAEICVAGNQDTDGDGSTDIWGFNQRENLQWNFIYSNGAEVVTKTDSGVEVDLSDPKIIEALAAYQDFMKNVPHQRGWLGDWQSQIWNFRDGTVMMCLEELWISYSYLGEMQDDWGFVPFPKGPSADDWSCYGKEVAPFFMLNGVEDPKTVALIYDLITDVVETDEEWDEMMEIQLEAWCNDAKSVDIIMDIFNRGLIKVNPIQGFGDLHTIVNNMFNDISGQASTPQTAIETYDPQIQAAIEDLMNHDYDADMEGYLKTEEE